MPLITLTEAKVFLGITDASQDARLNLLLPAVDLSIMQFVRGPVEEETDIVEKQGGSGTPMLFPRRTPVLAVTYIRIIDVDGATVRELDPDEYAVAAKGAYIALKSSQERPTVLNRMWDLAFPAGVDNLELKYSAGYDPVPEDFRTAAFMTISWFNGRARAGGLKSERLGNYAYEVFGDSESMRKNGGLPPEAAGLLLSRKQLYFRKATLPLGETARQFRD